MHILVMWDLDGLHPLKSNMKPKNHPIEKENHLPNLFFWVPALNSQGWLGNSSAQWLCFHQFGGW